MHHTLLNQMKYLHHRRNNESNISFNDCHHNLQLNDINFSNEYTINIDKWWILKKYQLIFCISQYSGIIEIRILAFIYRYSKWVCTYMLAFFIIFSVGLITSGCILNSLCRNFQSPYVWNRKKWTNCERINI